MKAKKLIATLSAVLVCAALVLTGCTGGTGGPNGPEPVERPDETKSQLRVYAYDAGFGTNWLTQAKKDFEAQFADVSFEEGKTGVQLLVTKGQMAGNELTASIKTRSEDVFFTELMNYTDDLNRGNLLDISEVVTGSLADDRFGDWKDTGDKDTVLEKLNEQQADFLNIQGKYYAVPFYFATVGFNYDLELWDNEKLYMDQSGEFCLAEDDEGKSLGADGIPGTPDDGLPETYEQFFKLCAFIKNELTMIPMTWSGQYQFYSTRVLYSLVTEALGVEKSQILYDFDSKGTEYDVVSDVSNAAADPVTGYAPLTMTKSKKAIASGNAGDAFRIDGAFADALNFMYTIVKNNYFDADHCFLSGLSHRDVQDAFLLSGRETQRTTRIAMLLDGNWWENEADPGFEMMDGRYPDSGKMDRRFGFMPLPRPTAEQAGAGKNHTLVEQNRAYMFASSKIANDPVKVNLAKLFLQFINTDKQLRQFTRITGTPRNMQYQLTDADRAEMSEYGQNFFDYMMSDTTEIIYGLSKEAVYLNNSSKFGTDDRFAYGSFTSPSTAFKDTPSLTPDRYYTGLTSNWDSKLADMFR